KGEKEVKVELEEKKEEPQFDPNKVYEFRLTKAKKGRKNLPREAVAWDEELGKPRKIRYSRTEDSPYVEEQSEFATAATIAPVFKDGVLKVKGTEKALLTYLMAHDGFRGKKMVSPQNRTIKNTYYLHDPEAIAKAARKREELVLKAYEIVKKAK